jgi:glycerophosphoryl diester phosphodiesterase
MSGAAQTPRAQDHADALRVGFEDGAQQESTVARALGQEHESPQFLRHTYVYQKFMAYREVIAHRGASAYAPENTIPAFELAVQQAAGCVEHDLQITKDGILVCVHDPTLERTTNARDVFSRRGRDVQEGKETVRRWFVHDFTLAEIRQLEAGSWFSLKFVDTRIPTFDELLEWSRNVVDVLTEVKDVELYLGFGVDPLELCAKALERHGCLAGSGDAGVTVQSFHEPTVRRAARLLAPHVPVALLVEPMDSALLSDRDKVAAIADFANGIGPGKAIVADRPEIVDWAHRVGLRVTPWTFRSSTTAPFASVAAEVTHYLVDLHVDAVITDHPDAAVSTR